MRLRRLSALLAAALVTTGVAAADEFTVVPAIGGQAVFSCESLRASGSATIDSAGATATGSPVDRGDVRSNGDVVLDGAIVVRGNAVAGPGKSVRLTGGATVTGTSSSATSTASCLPVDLAALSARLAAGNDNGRIPATAKGKAALGGPGRTDFSVGANDSLLLPAGTYFFTSFTLSGRASVTLGGPVRILCTGVVDLGGGSLANAAGSPYALRLWSTGASVKLAGGSALGGFLYAPSSTVAVGGGSRVVGESSPDRWRSTAARGSLGRSTTPRLTSRSSNRSTARQWRISARSRSAELPRTTKPS